MTSNATVGALRPRSARYQRLPILDGLDWSTCLCEFDQGEWYCVVFRSVRRDGASFELLTEFDDRAHAEALASGGLLLYFRGELDAEGGCLSLCLWTDRESARTALFLPEHRAAIELADSMYEWFHIERYAIRKSIDGTITAEPSRVGSRPSTLEAIAVAAYRSSSIRSIARRMKREASALLPPSF